MTNQDEKMDHYFFQLVLSLQAGAMQQLGKIMSPATGEIERDLSLAKNTIDMLGMIERKMKGNMTDEEEKLIGRVLTDLRLNYVDETKKGQADAEKPVSDSDEGSDQDEKDTKSGHGE